MGGLVLGQEPAVLVRCCTASRPEGLTAAAERKGKGRERQESPKKTGKYRLSSCQIFTRDAGKEKKLLLSWIGEGTTPLCCRENIPFTSNC